MTLTELNYYCDLFTRRNFVEIWESPEGADGECEMASSEFMRWFDRIYCREHDVVSGLALFISAEDLRREREKNKNFCASRWCSTTTSTIIVPALSYEDPPHNWYRNGCRYPGHIVNRISQEHYLSRYLPMKDDFFVDWTARQFHPNAPWPLIFQVEKQS